MSASAAFHQQNAPAPAGELLQVTADLVRRRMSQSSGPRPLIVGICGAQGSGKTTLARALVAALCAEGVRAAALSLDDLYLTRADRAELARTVHPLLATRGVPGTHDVRLGLSIFSALATTGPVALPRFDKARDDRAPEAEWHLAPRGCEVLVFEGWCVGARPQGPAELVDPVNDLERVEDADGRWRRHVNDCLGGAYQELFARIDALVLLAAPSFDVVAGWRLQQETELAAQNGEGGTFMDAAAVARFVQYYERLTRHILTEMPPRVDLLARFGPEREVLSLSGTP